MPFDVQWMLAWFEVFWHEDYSFYFMISDLFVKGCVVVEAIESSSRRRAKRHAEKRSDMFCIG
jgi:hypothetical protein